MKITIPMTPKPKQTKVCRRGRYVQTYEDSTMKTYKQQVKPILEEQNLN